jgi:outer membrane receptor protein involved in Fe transport
VGVYTRPLPWLTVDADYAASKSRFRDADVTGPYIPGALRDSVSLGITAQIPSGWFASARLRHLGSAPLIEDGSVRAPSSTLLTLDAGHTFGDRWRVSLSVFNLLDARVNDIAYYYASQLPTETAPVADIHFHPAEPRTLRAMVEVRF